MDLFTQIHEPKPGIRIFAVNVQSPPKERAMRLAAEISKLNANIIVLSELSSANGSQALLDNLYSYARYDIFWQKPEKNDYAVGVCVKGIPASSTLKVNTRKSSRVQIIELTINSLCFFLVGVYVPSLNQANSFKRESFFCDLKAELINLKKTANDGIVLLGDVNCVSPFHVPTVQAFAQEGYPLELIIRELDMVDLFQTKLPKQEYTWASPDGANPQLLDNCYVSSSLASHINRCDVLHGFRTEKLTDHSGILLEGFE